MKDQDYPVGVRLSGTTHFLSVKRAMELIRDMNEQIDEVFSKTRKQPTAKRFHKAVGANIRRERGVLRLSSAWVAKQSGLSVSFLSEVENGKRGISSENLVKVAKAVGCKIEDLLRGAA